MNKAIYTKDVPNDRLEVLGAIKTHKKPVKVMIIGGTDSGKTTAMVFLANELLSLGFRIAVIDSDIGQKGILPPATITLGFPDRLFSSPDEITPYKHYFIGSITPNQFFGEMITGVRVLVDEALKKADVILIDTTGFVHDSGVDLKRMKIEAIKPDIILALERENELEPVLKPFENKIRIFKLKVSENIRKHSREERREIRRKKWRTYFKNSKSYLLNLNEYHISGTSLFRGEEMGEEEKRLLESLFKWLIIYGVKTDGRYFVVKVDLVNFPRQVDRNTLHYIDFERLSNLVVGLIDDKGFCVGLGILKAINFKEKTIEVLTPLPEDGMGKVREIRFGRIRVREDGEELGLLDRNLL